MGRRHRRNTVNAVSDAAACGLSTASQRGKFNAAVCIIAAVSLAAFYLYIVV